MSSYQASRRRAFSAEMKIIKEGRQDIIKIWGRASLKDTEYRLIRYHIRTDCEDGTLMLNTVTGELVLLDPEEAKMLEALPMAGTPELQELIAKRFLVPKDYDELKAVDQLRKLMRKLLRTPSITGYSILPTTACNARCFYCYESDMPHYTMTEEIANRSADYIADHCGSENKVSLNWFGGEPTVGEKRIDQICDRLTEKGISFTSSMISNGYLFTPEMVSKAKAKWKLRNIQITLDGTEEIYNRTKAYVNVEGSPYQRVIRNIGLLLDADIRVSVRMNLDFHNAEDLSNLVKELAAYFGKKEKFSAYVHELFEDQGFTPVRHDEGARNTLIKMVDALNATIEEAGCVASGSFRTQYTIPSLKAPYCMADNLSTLQINPLGQLGKCEHMLFTELVGDLEHGHDYTTPEVKCWTEPEYKEGCKTCVLYPFCGVLKRCETTDVCLPAKARSVEKAIAVLMQNMYHSFNAT